MRSEATRSAGAVAQNWWRGLAQSNDGKPAPGSRAALAKLRRAGSPLEVMMEPDALRLIQWLQGFDADRVAVVAGVLAYVREDVDARIIRIVGRNSLEDEMSAMLSESRFRRLLQTPPDNLLLLEAMRRLVRLAKKANVANLAESILYWGDRRKKQWIFDYYRASSVTPSSAQAEASTTPLARQGDTR